MRYPHFVNGSFASRSGVVALERTINWYIKPMSSPGARNRVALFPTPGVTSFATGLAIGNRGMFEQNGRAYAVNAGKFCELMADGSFTEHGTMATDANPATIAGNGEAGGQILVSSGNNGYLFTQATNAFALVRTGGTRMVAHLDGFFLALDDSDSTYYLSGILDGVTWDPTQRFQRQVATDKWRAMHVVGKLVYLIGEKTCDVHYNAGGETFPFLPHPGDVIPYGISAPFAADASGSALIWPARTDNGEGEIVMATAGGGIKVISPPELQAEIGTYTDRAGAISETYAQDGHVFYTLAFEADRKGWTYDSLTGLWCERGTWVSEEMKYAAPRTLFHCYAFGKHLVGDRNTGIIYRMSETLYRDVEEREIRRVRQAPAVAVDDRVISFSDFRVLMDTGIGLEDPNAQGYDPVMEMEFTNNSGRTWVNCGTRRVGKLGDHGRQVRWMGGLGSARQRAHRIITTDPVPFLITDAFLEAA